MKNNLKRCFMNRYISGFTVKYRSGIIFLIMIFLAGVILSFYSIDIRDSSMQNELKPVVVSYGTTMIAANANTHEQNYGGLLPVGRHGIRPLKNKFCTDEIEIKIKSKENTASNPNRLEFALVKGVDPAYIVLAGSEHSGVHAAARDLKRDITKITGVTPNIVHSLKETASRCVVIGSADCPEGKALLASVGVPVDDLAGKWELFKYRILNNAGGKEQLLAIAGSNLRGTIFGIYDFEQKHLNMVLNSYFDINLI